MFRRKKWSPPKPDPAEREKAKKAVAEAVRQLHAAMAKQPEVDEVTGELKKIRRENHLVPGIRRALGAHSE